MYGEQSLLLFSQPIKNECEESIFTSGLQNVS